MKLLETKLKSVEAEISEINYEKNFNIVKDNINHLVDDTENLNCIKMWQLKKRICSKSPDPPIAKLNEQEELVTESSQLKQLYEATYKKRLKHRVMKPELEQMYILKMELFTLRLCVTRNVKSDNWSEDNLIQVLKKLKKNKSSDSQGLIYELFRPEIIGSDLFSSLLMFCNNVKSQLMIPEFLTFTDITSVWKSKGQKSDLDNDRGLFGVSKVRSIIEKLIYEDKYPEIDGYMSDSNVGGRRKRNIRDNLFVLYAIINESIRNKKSIDIHFYDLDKCFDEIWAEETMNYFYDAGVKDDKFSLVNLFNEKCNVKVKTPVGDTERFTLNRIEMQGTVPAPLKCAVQVDTLGRDMYMYSTGLYQYRDMCSVPVLGMIDDLAGVSDCSENSVILNSIINAKIE